MERDHGHELSQLEPRRDGAARDTGRGPGVQQGVRRAEPVQEVERGLCEVRRDERTQEAERGLVEQGRGEMTKVKENIVPI